MKQAMRLLLATCLLVGLSAWAQKKECFVVNAQGQKVMGETLTADRDGNLTLQVGGGGPTMSFRKGQYRSAGIPKPKDVGSLEQGIAEGKSDYVLKEAPAAFAKYQYLGWGAHICMLEGRAHLQKKAYPAAKQAFDRALALPDVSQTDALQGKIEALIGLKQNDEALALVKQLIQSASPDTAAAAFNARGQLLAAEGKKKEAVLEYLKTLLLFEPGRADAERAAAKKAAVALLKELGDLRAADIEKIP